MPHKRKVSVVPDSRVNSRPLYMSKQSASSMSTPLIVCSSINAYQGHHKSKDTLMVMKQLKLENDIQSIYSKPVTIITSKSSTKTSIKIRKKEEVSHLNTKYRCQKLKS